MSIYTHARLKVNAYWSKNGLKVYAYASKNNTYWSKTTTCITFF